MILLRYEVAPNTGTDASQECGGAYANVWADVDDPADADSWARDEIAEAGWNVIELIETTRLDPNDSAIPAEARQYVQEALEEGMSLVFYSWPPGAEDE